jgi:hypothetical protein
MKIEYKILAGFAVVGVVVGIYSLSKKKAPALAATPAKSELYREVEKALSRFSEASPVGVTGGIAPDKAQVARGVKYLDSHLTKTQKQMFIQYSNEFMDGTEKWATSHLDDKSIDEQKATDAFMEILANIQTSLEKQYGKVEADKFMLFMNSFDPKKV